MSEGTYSFTHNTDLFSVAIDALKKNSTLDVIDKERLLNSLETLSKIKNYEITVECLQKLYGEQEDLKRQYEIMNNFNKLESYICYDVPLEEDKRSKLQKILEIQSKILLILKFYFGNKKINARQNIINNICNLYLYLNILKCNDDSRLIGRIKRNDEIFLEEINNNNSLKKIFEKHSFDENSNFNNKPIIFEQENLHKGNTGKNNLEEEIILEQENIVAAQTLPRILQDTKDKFDIVKNKKKKASSLESQQNNHKLNFNGYIEQIKQFIKENGQDLNSCLEEISKNDIKNSNRKEIKIGDNTYVIVFNNKIELFPNERNNICIFKRSKDQKDEDSKLLFSGRIEDLRNHQSYLSGNFFIGDNIKLSCDFCNGHFFDSYNRSFFENFTEKPKQSNLNYFNIFTDSFNKSLLVDDKGNRFIIGFDQNGQIRNNIEVMLSEFPYGLSYIGEIADDNFIKINKKRFLNYKFNTNFNNYTPYSYIDITLVDNSSFSKQLSSNDNVNIQYNQVGETKHKISISNAQLKEGNNENSIDGFINSINNFKFDKIKETRECPDVYKSTYKGKCVIQDGNVYYDGYGELNETISTNFLEDGDIIDKETDREITNKYVGFFLPSVKTVYKSQKDTVNKLYDYKMQAVNLFKNDEVFRNRIKKIIKNYFYNFSSLKREWLYLFGFSYNVEYDKIDTDIDKVIKNIMKEESFAKSIFTTLFSNNKVRDAIITMVNEKQYIKDHVISKTVINSKYNNIKESTSYDCYKKGKKLKNNTLSQEIFTNNEGDEYKAFLKSCISKQLITGEGVEFQKTNDKFYNKAFAEVLYEIYTDKQKYVASNYAFIRFFSKEQRRIKTIRDIIEKSIGINNITKDNIEKLLNCEPINSVNNANIDTRNRTNNVLDHQVNNDDMYARGANNINNNLPERNLQVFLGRLNQVGCGCIAPF